MKKLVAYFRSDRFTLVIVVLVVCFAALPADAGKLVSWKEEVLLHDGSKIIVKRWQKHDYPPSYVGVLPDDMKDPKYLAFLRDDWRASLYYEKISSAFISEQGINFQDPKTKTTIVWEDGTTKEIKNRSFNLVALHIKDGIPYLITEPANCAVYNKWGRPTSSYIIFKFEDRVWWKVIPISELPPDFKTVNLVISTAGDNEKILDNLCLVTVAKVKELNGWVKDEKYKTIVRNPFVGCPEMFYCGANSMAWALLETFKKQPSYEACMKECKKIQCEEKYCPCEKLFNNKNRKGE